MSLDKLTEKIRATKTPVAVDLSFDPGLIPQSVRKRGTSDVEAYHIYSRELIDALKGLIPAVRLRLGSFALLGAYGMELLRETAKYARFRGFYLLLDVPQTNSTAAAELSAEYLIGENAVCPADGIIIDIYAGSDVVKPYVKRLEASGKSLFVTLRTANRSASELQDLLTGSRLVHMAAADIVSGLGKPYVSKSGYSPVCAMASATSGDSLKNLRAKYPNMFLLVDGYDLPSADAKKCSYAFDKLGHGALVCAGEGIIGAWREAADGEENYLPHILEAVKRMKNALRRHVLVL